MKSEVPRKNPFGMRELSPGGPFTVGSEMCSQWKKIYLMRTNRILASYSIISGYSDIGHKHVASLEEMRKINMNTHFKIAIGSKFIRCDYKTLKKMHNTSIKQLSIQAFLMIYGNLEAYIIDIVCEALNSYGCTDVEQEALNLMARTKWEGRIDAICQKFKVNVGKRNFFERYKSIAMEFCGTIFDDPIAFLQQFAEIRHLLVHHAGRVSENLIKSYPYAGLKKDMLIEIPAELPFEFNIFLMPFVDVFDVAFSSAFSWERSLEQPEKLLDV